MDGLQDEAKQVDEGAAQQTQGESAQASSGEGVAADGGATPKVEGGISQARADYEAALKERDVRIAELEGEIAEAAKTAENAEKLRAEMDELRRRGDGERVGFELALAGARNVKAARALLSDHSDDVEKPKAAEPWLFGAAAAAPATSCATGLPNAGEATDEGAQLKRRRGIAGLPEYKE